ncbi:MAG: dienelactone hydrolase family protein [Gammaproteobacteria bacterium]|nr:dienelactone hydrolase family protein [Gammaproteobacteria bacterium]
MKNHLSRLLFINLMLIGSAFGAEVLGSKALATDFWLAKTTEEKQLTGNRLLAEARDLAQLHQWLKSGPQYAADVPRGYQEEVRLAEDGTRFPYVVLVPESYDPERSYAVEFMLHGGVDRPEWESGGKWWRRGYDSLEDPDRITVVPASWDEAFWWHSNQAENIPAILKRIKQTYNVNDNRVYLTGMSDGGTGIFFFAFKQSTEWAAFLPFISHPGVLQNPASGGYKLYFENLKSKPLYIVNGENDPLYPAASLKAYIEGFQQVGVNYIFKVIAGGGHNTQWMPQEAAMIAQFKQEHIRDPLPEVVEWITDDTSHYNRNHWLVIEELLNEDSPGGMQAQRDGNSFNVFSTNLSAFTLLLSPDEIDFNQPVEVVVNGNTLFKDKVNEDAGTLLKWAGRDLDKTMLFTAELTVKIPE